MRIQWICLTLLLAGLTISSSGCLALVVGAGAAGTVAYMAGDVESEEPYNIDQVYAATKKAAQDLKLHVVTGEGGKDALSATVIARDAADKRITVKLKATTVQTTKVSIRVGTFGNEAKSRLVYNKIRDNLSAASPLPSPAQASPATESEPAPPDPQVSQADVPKPEPVVSEAVASEPASQDASAPPASQ